MTTEKTNPAPDGLPAVGDRALGEFLAELGAERGITTIIDQRLERYAELESEVLQAAGGDEFWPTPVREVGDG